MWETRRCAGGTANRRPRRHSGDSHFIPGVLVNLVPCEFVGIVVVFLMFVNMSFLYYES